MANSMILPRFTLGEESLDNECPSSFWKKEEFGRELLHEIDFVLEVAKSAWNRLLVFPCLSSVGLKQLCVLEYLGCNCKSGISL